MVTVTPNATITGTLTQTGVATFAAIPIFSYGATTAAVTQTQSGAHAAAALTKFYNKITTGTSGDGVELPVAVAGKCVMVRNTHASNTLKVYGVSAAKVNGVTASTGAVIAAFTGVMCCSDGTDWDCTGTSS